MTTIFASVKDGLMVCDSKCTAGDNTWYPMTKVHRHEKELVGIAGNVKEGNAWLKWYQSGKKGARPKLESFSALILRADGLYEACNDGLEMRVERGYHGVGSGGPCALDGFSLQDHFPAWKPCWSVWNGDSTVIKHRYKGGVHATHNNTVNAGVNIVTGHLHSLKIAAFTDYKGTRYGVDTGTLAEPKGPQFENYMEQNPANWRSGFAVLTFHKGRLLMPELVQVCGLRQLEFRALRITVLKEASCD